MINDSFLDQLNLATPFSTIETEFGRFLCRLSRMPAKADNDVPAQVVPPAAAADAKEEAPAAGEPADALWRFLAFLLLRYVRDGHSCVDVEHWRQALLAQLQNEDEKAALSGEARKNFRIELSALSASSVHDAIRALAKAHPLIMGGKAAEGTPLVFHESAAGQARLYLNKYRQYELDVAAWMRQAVAAPRDGELPMTDIQRVSSYYSASSASEDNPGCQPLAIQKAVGRRFAIITGGPGTGKTTVLAAILGLICRDNPTWRIALAAPTGKAKARMQEAIGKGVKLLTLAEDVKKQLLSLPASTVHTLIGLRPDAATPIYHAGKRLPYDLVVVDEASMVSLPNMAQLLRALKPDARLLLLGDKDQLSSVETGSVMADLCQCQTLLDAIAVLHKNYRAKDNRALTEFAQRVVMTTDASAIAQLAEDLYTAHADPSQAAAEFAVSEPPSASMLADALKKVVADWGLSGWKKGRSPDEFFAFADSFKILASNREGDFGVKNLNAVMCEILGIAPYADGTPVMILRNDKLTGLNNGDIGVVWENQVYFPNPEREGEDSANKYRVYALGGLPDYELVYAMTIHKSQGSGYKKVLMVLPEKDNPVLTRELVYTGITRTELKFRLWAPKEVLQTALLRPTRRISGLITALDNDEA